jgi:hypothetical protein
MATLTRSEQQIAFFETFGYLGLPGILRDRIGSVIDDFEALWAERGGGHGGRAHDGEARSCIAPFIDQSENLSALLDDPRIRSIGAQLLGDMSEPARG